MGRKLKLRQPKRYYLNKTRRPKKFRRSPPTTLSVPLAILPKKVNEDHDVNCSPLPLKVSIPLSSLPDGDKLNSFVVSIPVEYCKSVNSIQLLRGRISNDQLPEGWVLIPRFDQGLKLCYFHKNSDKPNIVVKVTETLEYFISVEGHEAVIPPSWESFEKIDDYESFWNLLEKLSNAFICTGNADEQFVQICNHRKGMLHNSSGAVIAKLENNQTVRHVKCHMLVENKDERCGICKLLRKTLNSLASRYKRTNSTPLSIYTNIRYLTSPKKTERLKQLQSDKRTLKKNIARLKERIEKHTLVQGICLPQTIKEDFVSLSSAHHQQILKSYPENSFQRIFWLSQIKNCSSSKGHRWHPLMIKWCILLRQQSGRAYEMLRKSGIIELPSQRTLRDYTHHTKSTVGFSFELDRQLMDDAQVKSLSEYEKYVCLIGDEMHIKEDLVFDKFSGELTGFVNLGNINDHLRILEEHLDSSCDIHPQPVLATTVFVFMVRGIFIRLNFPYATFPAKAISADQLLPLYIEGLFRLERCGFKVVGMTLDGYSANRRLMNLLSDKSVAKIKHKTSNPFSQSKRFIYFFSDPPHLLKTIRNSFASPKRNLMKNGQKISWQFIVDLYLMATESMGLTTQHKLKHEHVYLNSFSKMRVDLAAQVLSETVANGLRFNFKESAEETAIFIEKMDKFFDCLNVTNYTQCIRKLKPFKMPYRHEHDFRIKWLNDFLLWLDDWEMEVQVIDCPDAEKSKLMISRETLNGIRMTVHSFVELVPFLFSISGVTSFLSERISQDPLEKFFGRQRIRGGVNDNPNVSEFLKNNQALRVANSIDLDFIKGNCRGSNKRSISSEKENCAPLKKRQHTCKMVKDTEVDKTSPIINPFDPSSPAGMFVQAVKAAVEDEGFRQLPSHEARTGLSSAEAILNWALSANSTVVQKASTDIFLVLQEILTTQPSTKVHREKLWVGFFEYVKSEKYELLWSSIVKLAKTEASPTLYYFVTNHMLNELLHEMHPGAAVNHDNGAEIFSSEFTSLSLSRDEEAALSYVGGYLVRAVTKKVKKSPEGPNKNGLLLALDKLHEHPDDVQEEADNEDEKEPDWLSLCNRGGLYLVRTEFQNFLLSAEVIVKRLTKNIESMKIYEKIKHEVKKDEDVLFWWEVVCSTVMIDNDTSVLLFEMVLQHYLVVRGFCVTARWLESYKTGQKKNIQKSKGLRKKILS